MRLTHTVTYTWQHNTTSIQLHIYTLYLLAVKCFDKLNTYPVPKYSCEW